jgi:hypothetical protein
MRLASCLLVTIFALVFLIQTPVFSEQIHYDALGPDAFGQQRGSVWLNGEKYTVIKGAGAFGNEMQIKNYNNFYKGTIGHYGGSVLRNRYNYNDSINIRPFPY